ncbi:tetratricopeptide repeat protein [Candidatus Uhrbacteria bacterium]|nr:tetratricopeptide repeat protein [Candidatus Uhrbacteria bacterium]
MKHGGQHVLSAARGLLMILIFLMPLFFLPVTLEPLEINKQTLLVVLTCAAALCWLGSMLLTKHVRVRSGWVNVLPLLILSAFVLPAIFSVAPYLSWVGAHRQEYMSVLTVGAIALLIYLLTNTMGERKQHQQIHLTLLVSSSLVAFIAVLEILGVHVVTALAPSLTLNTVGTLTALTTFLIVSHSFSLGTVLAHKKGDSLLYDKQLGVIEQILIFFLSCSTLFFLLVLDDGGLWALLMASLAILFSFVVFRAKDFPSHARLIWPMCLLVLAVLFWFVLPGITSFSIPLEITLNGEASRSVATQTLETFSSAFGSGPGTYTFDFSQFRNVNLNETDFWNTRFDRGSSYFLTLVPTIGLFGVGMFALFILFLLGRSLTQVIRPSSRDEWLESFVHLTPWLTLIVSGFLVSWNMTLVVSFGIFSGLLASQVLRKEWNTTLKKVPGISLVISSVFTVLSIVFLVGIFVMTQRYTAEIAFAQAIEIDRDEGDLQQVVRYLDRASMLNSHLDTYYRNLGEALLLRLDEELSGVNSIDTLTDESTQYIQSLAAASVNAVAKSTTLSSHNVLNWLSRGHIYRELIPVLGEASEFALVSYQTAIELEPMNPSNWTELGKTYLAAAEHTRPLILSSNTDIAMKAQQTLTQMLDQAETAFEKAVELKPNYAPAHFQLAVTYERQGRMIDAITKMESVAQYNQFDVGVAFELGMLYLQRNQTGDLDRAKSALLHTIKLMPSYSNAHWFLASIYEQEGDIAEAVQEIEIVLQLNPNNELVRSRLERLSTGQISTRIPEAIEE